MRAPRIAAVGMSVCLAVVVLAQTPPASAKPYVVDDIVEINVGPDQWLKGRILKVLPNNIYTVHFDTDRPDTTVAATRLRRPSIAAPANPKPAAPVALAPPSPAPEIALQVGDRIEIQLGEKWLPGRVLRLMPDGTFFVRFDALGESEDSFVPASRIRRNATPAAPGASASTTAPSTAKIGVGSRVRTVPKDGKGLGYYTVVKVGNSHCYLTNDESWNNLSDGWFVTAKLEFLRVPTVKVVKRDAMFKPNLKSLPPEPPDPELFPLTDASSPHKVSPSESGPKRPRFFDPTVVYGDSDSVAGVDCSKSTVPYVPDARPKVNPFTGEIKLAGATNGFVPKSLFLLPIPELQAVVGCEKPTEKAISRRIERVNLVTGESLGVSQLPDGVLQIAVSPDGKFAVGGIDKTPDTALKRLAIYDIRGERARELSRFQPYAESDEHFYTTEILQVLMPTNEIIVTSGAVGRVAAWNLTGATPQCIWRADFPRNAAATISLTPTAKYIILSSQGSTILLESTTGKVAFATVGEFYEGFGDLSDDGSLIAINSFTSVNIRSLVNSNEPHNLAHEALWPRKRLRFVGTDLLLVDRQLFDLKMNFPIWNYHEVDHSVIAGRRMFYLPKDNSPVIHSLELGDTKVMDAREKLLASDDVYLLKPGATVALDISVGDGAEAKVDELLRKALERINVKAGNNPRLRLVARTSPAQPITVSYKFRDEREGHEMSFTPINWTLKLEIDGKSVWNTGGQSTCPTSLVRRAGESLEQAVEREKRTIDFYMQGITLPSSFLNRPALVPQGTTELP